MPRVLTEQQKREKALRVSVSRAKEEQGFRSDQELAAKLGIDRSTYSRYKQDAFQKMSLSAFAKMARTLNFTPEDVCSAIGITYKEA